jgi:membrane-associated phospholipid phosphatase
MLADALITTRDGIVGTWSPPDTTPTHLGFDDPDNLRLWEPRVRAAIFDAELFERLFFTAETDAGAAGMSVWHLAIPGAAAGDAAPAAGRLVRVDRPPETVFKEQLTLVHDYADLRPDRATETLAQLGMPTGFLASVAFLRDGRARHTLELLALAFRLAQYVEMRIKHALACRRPIEYSPQVQPIILTPGHGTLPSGHATEAFTLATVLWALLRAGGNPVYGDSLYGAQLMRLAARIAINRQVAGVHFPVDSAAGAVLGVTLARYLVARLDGSPSAPAHAFRGHLHAGDRDFLWSDYVDLGAADLTEADGVVGPLPGVDLPPADGSPALRWLWREARAEWA